MWCCLVWSARSPALLIVVTLLLVAHVVYAIKRYAWLRRDNACIRLEITSQHKLNVSYKNGHCDRDVRVRHDSVVSPYLILLSYTPRHVSMWRRVLGHYLIIMKDSTDAESYRKLSVWLRWAHHAD